MESLGYSGCWLGRNQRFLLLVVGCWLLVVGKIKGKCLNPSPEIEKSEISVGGWMLEVERKNQEHKIFP
jgi:hypothetical protein